MEIMVLHKGVKNARNGNLMVKYIKPSSCYLNIFKVNFLKKNTTNIGWGLEHEK